MNRIDDEIVEKTGQELFKELLRFYPVAEYEDYFKAGKWQDELLRCDLHLLWAHRREAGAPDPIPLEEVKMPTLPVATAASAAAAAAGGLRPVAAAVARPSPAASYGQAAGAAGTSPAAELRLIALFVAKWKLEPTKTKFALAKLTPQRRRYVIQHFKLQPPPTAPGPASDSAFSEYVTQCHAENVWPAPKAGTPGTPVPAGVVATPTAKPAGPKIVAAFRPMGAAKAGPPVVPARRPVMVRGSLMAAGTATPTGGFKRPGEAVAGYAAKQPKLAGSVAHASWMASAKPVGGLMAAPKVMTPRPKAKAGSLIKNLLAQ